eukprot:GILK01001069.1.p1 GENE.GILK01001069.1~~GILK01001069.1.p1  ORF type:complete len:247 (-),score=41.99 GILK01001069.1:366-1043(-)
MASQQQSSCGSDVSCSGSSCGPKSCSSQSDSCCQRLNEMAVDIEGVESALESLSLNPYEIEEPALAILLKLISNVIANPDEAKFRAIKKSNPALHAKVLSVHGGSEFLMRVGFRDLGETLQLPADIPLDSLEIARDILAMHIEAERQKEEVHKKSEYEEQQRALRERNKKLAAEKELLRQQIENDRKERAQRLPSVSSHATQLHFGANTKGFKDCNPAFNQQSRG